MNNFPRNRLEPRTYISTKDFVNHLLGSTSDLKSPYESTMENFSIKAICLADFGMTATMLSWIGNQTKINELLTQYIFPKYWNHMVGYIDEESPNWNTLHDFFRNFLIKLLSKLSDTALLYEKILALYDAKKNALMDAIGSTTESSTKFNDTPQEKESGSEYVTDDYVSNIAVNKSETKNDGATVMSRLKEIRDNYENLMVAWAMDLSGLFMSERGSL